MCAGLCCHLPALSVTFAFMIERCEPVGDLLTNTAQQRLRKARSELCFIGETRVSHGIVYCTHVHWECLGCQGTDSAPHVETSEEDLLSGLTPSTRSDTLINLSQCHIVT